jgi:hypothetical protein
VVLPASGWEMMAKVRLLLISSSKVMLETASSTELVQYFVQIPGSGWKRAYGPLPNECRHSNPPASNRI